MDIFIVFLFKFLLIFSVSIGNTTAELVIQFDFDCAYREQPVCIFTEFFEEDDEYEQLLERTEQCAQVTFQAEGLSEMRPQLIPVHRLPEVSIETASIIRPYTFRLLVQMTHNCTATSEIRCYTWDVPNMWMGTERSVQLPRRTELTDRGERGPCSDRWQGGMMWNWEMEKTNWGRTKRPRGRGYVKGAHK